MTVFPEQDEEVGRRPAEKDDEPECLECEGPHNGCHECCRECMRHGRGKLCEYCLIIALEV